MAYSEEELADFWVYLKDRPATNRQDAIDFTEDYTYDPENATNLSDSLEGVLDKDGAYIQRARAKANEQSNASGLLGSSMAAGAAEGAAIDRGLEVAQGDVDVSKFNAGAQTEADKLRYGAATDIAGREQEFANQSGLQDSEFVLGEIGKISDREHELDMVDTEFDYQKQLDELRQQQDLDKLEWENFYEKGIISEQQQDMLDKLAVENEYNRQIESDKFWYNAESDLLKYASAADLEAIKAKASINAQVMDAYGVIASSDMTAEEKNAQIAALLGAAGVLSNASNVYDAIQLPAIVQPPDVIDKEIIDNADNGGVGPEAEPYTGNTQQLEDFLTYYTDKGTDGIIAVNNLLNYMADKNIPYSDTDEHFDFIPGHSEAIDRYSNINGGQNESYGPTLDAYVGNYQGSTSLTGYYQALADAGWSEEDRVNETLWYGMYNGASGADFDTAFGMDTKAVFTEWSAVNPSNREVPYW